MNYYFTIFFLFEMLIKLYALGLRGYFFVGWNRFDFVIVSVSVVDVVVQIFAGSLLAQIQVGTSITRIFRVMRVSRLFKLFKQLKGDFFSYKKVFFILFYKDLDKSCRS